ncbi:MAG TPA: hypothetical protein VFE94_04170 [Candidatus Paceibacterota bacterium]|nr:hypothetical protein [Candidatus Paceibacterota bacterium]
MPHIDEIVRNITQLIGQIEEAKGAEGEVTATEAKLWEQLDPLGKEVLEKLTPILQNAFALVGGHIEVLHRDRIQNFQYRFRLGKLGWAEEDRYTPSRYESATVKYVSSAWVSFLQEFERKGQYFVEQLQEKLEQVKSQKEMHEQTARLYEDLTKKVTCILHCLGEQE